MCAAAKRMIRPITDRVDIQSTKTDGKGPELAWQSFTLHSSQLSNTAEAIQSTGLGNLEELYLSIIPPLRGQTKLPRPSNIVERTRKHAEPYERLQHWKQAGEAYL